LAASHDVTFRNKLFTWWSFSTTPNPQPGGPVDYTESGSCLLPCGLSGLGDPATSLRSRQHSFRGHQNSQVPPPTVCASTRW